MGSVGFSNMPIYGMKRIASFENFLVSKNKIQRKVNATVDSINSAMSGFNLLGTPVESSSPLDPG